ncbi:MBL fold metallo-hydrolase, partial [Candidatus Saganbacteria bacterium]|nr:MBL fold metallo-hydrolase [Candidatus Saganbacteria bacterium]
HSADINVMMEAMTLGGYKKKGVVLTPKDALEGKDPVIYKYNRSYVDKIEILKTGKDYKIGKIGIKAAIRHRHDVETYGLIIKSGRRSLSYITDTKFFPGLAKAYKDEILIVSVLRYNPTPYDHLCVREAKEIIREIKPKTTILTHFGMEMIKSKPWKIAEDLTKELKTKVIAASDGMLFKI